MENNLNKMVVNNLIWHDHTEKPENGEKDEILVYNVEKDCLDISYYSSVCPGFIWCYFKDILPSPIKEKYIERADREYQEYLKEKDNL